LRKTSKERWAKSRGAEGEVRLEVSIAMEGEKGTFIRVGGTGAKENRRPKMKLQKGGREARGGQIQ